MDDANNPLFQLSEDVYKYVIRLAPLLLCFGFVLSLIQKTVRFAYYEVDHLYLMEIRTEEVLQGLSYLFALIYYAFFVYRISAWKEERIALILDFMAICLYVLFLIYTQTYYIDISQIARVLACIALATGVMKVIVWIIALWRRWHGKENVFLRQRNICLFVFLPIFAVAALQYTVEDSNKRFTYVTDGNRNYIIVTTFKEHYITTLSTIENNTITIHRGNVRLFSLDRSITARQFTQKILQ